MCQVDEVIPALATGLLLLVAGLMLAKAWRRT